MGAATTPSPKTAMAEPRRSGGNDSSRIAWEIGCSAPPPPPWSTRATMSSPRLGAAPAANEASVKSTMHAIRKRLRPKMPPSQAVAGSTIALDTR